MIALPKLPDSGGYASVADLATRFYRFCAEVIEYARLIPQFEIKRFTSVGHYPIPVDTHVSSPAGVVCMRAVDDATGETIVSGGVGWRVNPDEQTPGILIDFIDGVPKAVGTSVPAVDVTLLIVGEVS